MTIHSVFEFPPDGTQVIPGGDRCGKTTRLAEMLIDEIAADRSVLVVLPDNRMGQTFQSIYGEVAVQRGLNNLQFWRLDQCVLTPKPWGKVPNGTYDTIIFVDGDGGSRESFHGHQFVFNPDVNLYSVLRKHAENIRFNTGARPRFVVACNAFNLVLERASVWILKLNRVLARGRPQLILDTLEERLALAEDVQAVIQDYLAVQTGAVYAKM